MTLREAPLPRMAGFLPFMRGRTATIEALRPGMVAAFGVPAGTGGERDGPRALRETSSYFGSHFTANMKAAMDIDQRRVLDASAVAGRVVDLGDVDVALADPSATVPALVRSIAAAGALPLLLGGGAWLALPLLQGLAAPGEALTLLRIGSDAPLSEPARFAGTRVVVALDLSVVAAQWHGASAAARFDGLSLSAVRERLRQAGALDVAGIAVTGLDPTRQGMSTVKTGQRLLVTALLDLIYARLGVLKAACHG